VSKWCIIADERLFIKKNVPWDLLNVSFKALKHPKTRGKLRMWAADFASAHESTPNHFHKVCGLCRSAPIRQTKPLCDDSGVAKARAHSLHQSSSVFISLHQSSRIFQNLLSRFSRTSLVCFVWAQMFSLIVSSMAKWIQNGRKSAGHHGTAIWHQSQPVTVVSATEWQFELLLLPRVSLRNLRTPPFRGGVGMVFDIWFSYCFDIWSNYWSDHVILVTLW